MNALVLDGSREGETRNERAADELASGLAARGYDVELIALRDLDIRACTGCFGCWTRTPGECVIADDARRIAERVVNSDVTAVVSPITFGGYGSLAKSVLDRLICLVLPTFTMVDGEVHHKPRYAHYPVWLALGTLAEPSAEETALFARVVERNAVNLYNPSHAVQIVVGDESAETAVEHLLASAGIRTEVLA
jgi:hypothetical protein